jgi:hypothetical protein
MKKYYLLNIKYDRNIFKDLNLNWKRKIVTFFFLNIANNFHY